MSLLLVFFFYIAHQGVVDGIFAGLAFIVLMLVHEMGHAWFVRKFNHDLIDIRIYPIHGVCHYEHAEHRLPETLIIAGGLIAQAILLVFWSACMGLVLLLKLYSIHHMLQPVSNVFFAMNIIMLVLNSLPIPGLDGFELWQRFWGRLKTVLFRQQPGPDKKRQSNLESSKKVVDLAIKRAQKK
ncbi:MAG: M50 family metallopeptidase [Gammaproteobacteria bacterium]|nr:M50 family metallopeptidase [Gammaproteobacteria bacterium]MDH5654043.1 M50 family metallopeptidase [Gammaproteobacteria bacterium]